MTDLQELFPSHWRAEDPPNLVDLLNAQYDELTDTAKNLRALAVELVHSFERAPIHTARDALDLLEKHHLPARRGKWATVALNADRERVYSRTNGGGMRLLHTVSNHFPTPDKLRKRVPLPDGGSYLLIYGGATSELADDDAEALATLKEFAPVTDVLFWNDTDTVSTFWSVRAGVGQSKGKIIPATEDANLRRWQL